MQNLNEIDNLVKIISKLPGLGPKSARRLILKMINNRNEILKPLVDTLTNVLKYSKMQNCGMLKSNINNCENCEASPKNYDKIYVVENIADNGR